MSPNDFQSLCVAPDCSLRDALERINQTGRGILLMLHSDGRLLRTVTDGDLRRALLQHLPDDWALGQLPEQQPIVASLQADAAFVLRLMDSHQIDHVPVVSAMGRPVDVVFRRELTQRIWLSSPHLGEEESVFVQDAFDTNWIAPLGPHVDGFERELAAHVGIGYAAALSSGTAALHLGLVLLGVGAGDTVFCSALTFVASCNPILYCGARPVFIDSEPESWNMSPAALERALVWAEREGRLPKCVVIVNLYGQSADMDALLPICQRYGVKVLEDAAESLGGCYKNRSSGTFGDLGVFSFNGNKIITTSGGGMLVSRDEALIARARKLSTQSREAARHYEHSEVGYNYRLSNVLAGIGRGQLKVLAQRVAQRRRVFERYAQALADLPQVQWMPEPSWSHSNRWLSCFTLAGPDAHWQIEVVMRALERHSIEARPIWKPMQLQPLFSGVPYFVHAPGQDVSAGLFASGMCLPSGSNLTPEQQDRVIDALRSALLMAEDRRAAA
jgi:dTDP-4-amino-4,6-dideoxygalactose transaminase